MQIGEVRRHVTLVPGRPVAARSIVRVVEQDAGETHHAVRAHADPPSTHVACHRWRLDAIFTPGPEPFFD